MKRLFLEMADLLRDGESFVTATIIRKTGSGPRAEGSRMIVRRDGTIRGSVGGGRLEADALRLAAALFHTRTPVVHAFDLTGEDAAGTDMICGGRGEILLDHVDASEPGNRIVYEAVAERLREGGAAWLVTAIDEGPGEGGGARRRCLVRQDGSTAGLFAPGPEVLATITSGDGRHSTRVESRGGRTLVVEPLRDGGTLFAFGAGHVSQKLVPLAEGVGFRTVVLDDRAEYANRALFPAPTELVVLESFSPLPELALDEDSYVVIVTRGHLHDQVVLEQALSSAAGYVGMIGSVRKRDLVYAAMLERGFGPPDLARVDSPIGTDIGAETPEEIAVSIVGAMIRARAKRLGRRGSNLPENLHRAGPTDSGGSP